MSVTFYLDEYYGGNTITISGQAICPDLRLLSRPAGALQGGGNYRTNGRPGSDFNNEIDSMQVAPGWTARIYTDVQYAGASYTVVGPANLPYIGRQTPVRGISSFKLTKS